MEFAQVQGEQVPKIGLGTWNMRGREAREAVLSALELGYRHIDTAEMYRNEREIGEALQKSAVPREEIFLVSKVWKNHMRADEVVHACQQSLKRLGTDYLDLYLIHWPSQRVPIEETMAGMEKLAETGQARRVGVSNFSVSQLKDAQRAFAPTLFADQVEFHVRHRQDPLAAYCADHDLLLTAYTPLAKGRLRGEETLAEIGRAHGKSALQVALRWLTQQENVVAIPKASRREHQRANLDIFDFALSQEQMQRINGLG